MRNFVLVATVVGVGGCGGRYTEPSLGADHPASPVAAQSPLPPRSHTLDLAAVGPIGPVHPDTPAGHRHGEAGEPSTPVLLPKAGEGQGGASTPAPPGAVAMYVCPMHPDVTSDKPDQRCPKCGMKLVRRGGGEP